MKIQMKGKVILVDRIDNDLAKVRWSNCKNHARNSSGFMHRVIMKRMIGEIPKWMQVDHVNRDGLDNRRRNLRLATHSENLVNTAKWKGASGFRGVRKGKANQWRADIQFNGRKLYLGTYKTKEQAASIYNDFASGLFGEFAYLNPL